jgi:flagellar export protein FliJ
MKTRDSVIRLRRFQVEEKRRQVSQIEKMIAEFVRMAGDLDDQIAVEQDRTGIHDVGHFAYPTFARAAMQRRDNLLASADELKAQLDSARQELEAAEEDLTKVELMAERDRAAEEEDDLTLGGRRRGPTALAG